MTKLDDSTLITTALIQRFEIEAELEGGRGAYYALLRRSNGSFVAHHPYGVALQPDMLLWASRVLDFLNTVLHHDGAWVYVFTHPKAPKLTDTKHAEYSRYVLMWMDKDGDVNLPIEWAENESEEFLHFADVVNAGMIAQGDRAEAAWQQWYALMRDRDLDLREGQTFKRAKGQRPASVRA